MINGVAAMIHRIAENDAEFSGKRVGDHGLALDQPGIAVARFLSCPLPIDEHDVAVALLQMQRDANSHDSRSEDDYIRACQSMSTTSRSRFCRCSATLTPTIPAPRTITSARAFILPDLQFMTARPNSQKPARSPTLWLSGLRRS